MHKFKGESKAGHVTGVMCPHRFCPGRIVYNGNYFCEMWDEGTCDFALQQDEYEQVYRGNGRWEQVLKYPAPPLHKRVWREIIIDVWGSVEAYEAAQNSAATIALPPKK